MFTMFKKKEQAVVEIVSEPVVELVTDVDEEVYATAPGTNIRFNPNLIPKLKHEHKELLTIFAEIQIASEMADYSKIAEKLTEFKRMFLDHILMESVSLYVYMKKSFHNIDDDDDAAKVQGFQFEMDDIGKVVRAFIAKYERIDVDQSLIETFIPELDAIGESLLARIEREEEQLYPLYQASYSAEE